MTRHIETGMEFVLVPGGSFTVGSSNNDKEVTVSSFLIAKHTVTQGVWWMVMETEPWKDDEFVREGDDYPAVYISWEDTKKFCKKVGLSLPTEAQWEYACRASTTTKYYWGDEPDSKYMWYYDNTCSVGEKYAHKVGLKVPNAYGLYDMSGNVWEWCDNMAGLRVRGVRGGSCINDAGDARSACSNGLQPEIRSYYLGFRLTCSLENQRI